MLPAPLCSSLTCWWWMQASFLLGVAFRLVICGFYLFFLPVRLPSKIRKLPPDLLVRGFSGVWKLPLLRLTSRDGSPSLTLLSLFSSFIFCLTSFRRQWAAFLGVWCPLLAIRSCFVEFAQRSSDLSMNLWRRKWFPHPIPPPSSLHILYPSLIDHFVFLLLSCTYIGSNSHDLFPLHTGEQITDWGSLSNSQLVSDFET